MIAILADSTCDLSQQQLGLSGVSIMPVYIQHQGSNEENRLISPEDMLERVRRTRQPAITVPPTPEECRAVYSELLQKADHVVHLTASRVVTKMHAHASEAAARLAGRVTVYDSQNVSYGLGQMALHAAQMADQKATPAQITAALDNLLSQMLFGFAVEKLDYLRINGRLSGAAALVGNLLGLKPLLTVQDGKLENTGRARGDNAARRELSKQALHFSRELARPMEIHYVYTAGARDHAETLRSELAYLQAKDGGLQPLGAGITANAGPAYGVVIVPA